MRGVHGLLAVACVCVVLGGAYAQAPDLDPNHPKMKIVPTVTFERVYPNDEPAHYAVSVESSGDAAYNSVGLGNAEGADGNGEPYIMKFTVSESTSMHIFELVRQAHNFKGKSGDDDGSNTGNRTLTYSEGPADSFGQPTFGVRNRLTYDESTDPAILQLTGIFAGISNSLELGRELEYLHRSRRAGLDAALKGAEDRARDHSLLELGAISHSLQVVADDPAVSDAARQRAQHLLKLAQSSPAE